MVRLFKSDIAITLFCLGALLPAISLSNYVEIPAERTLFKAFGSVAILVRLGYYFKLENFRFKSLDFQVCFGYDSICFDGIFNIFWDFSGSLPLASSHCRICHIHILDKFESY